MIDIEKVYAQIDEQRQILINLLNASKANPISPNRLSDVCMKLSILNELLGEHVVDLKAAQLAKEKEVYDLAKSEDISDTGAMQRARMGSVTERRAFEKADTRHSDLWKLISMAQSHIRSESESQRGTF